MEQNNVPIMPIEEIIEKTVKNFRDKVALRKKYIRLVLNEGQLVLNENGEPEWTERMWSLRDRICYIKLQAEREKLRMEQFRLERSEVEIFSQQWNDITDEIILCNDFVELYEKRYKCLIC